MRRVAALALLVATLVAPPTAAQDPNACDEPGDFPDVIVGEIDGVFSWGTREGVSAFSIGTWSCNVGTCWLGWIYDTPEHPVIGQNLFRWRDGRFEQIGQSWLKHGFVALSAELCDTGCLSTDGDHLGVNCADPYDASLNGFQGGLGPKFEVDPATGVFPYPHAAIGQGGDLLYKRLQVDNLDLDPALNDGARYFVEGQYVAADDAAAGRDNNNASWREVEVSLGLDRYVLSTVAPTVQRSPAIEAWATVDPGVTLTIHDVPDDGRLLVASHATEIGRGFWHYEYAVQNLNSSRAVGAIRVPVPGEGELVGAAFHDVRYHSGEPFVSDPWPAVIVEVDGARWLEWRVPPADPAVANALRWGTLYNVRFDSTRPPAPLAGAVELELFAPGSPAVVAALHTVPLICDDDGTCDAGESCANCPGDCSAPDAGQCGNGTCEPTLGEDCVGCSQDCAGVQSGNPGARYCCGDGAGDGPVDCGDPRCTANGAQCSDATGGACCGDGVCQPGEDPCQCEADCGPCLVSCVADGECDDGDFCNGVETCAGDSCQPGSAPCGSGICDEVADECVECLTDDHCDDGIYCSGRETCRGEVCVPGDPCPAHLCLEDEERCIECLVDEDCADDTFCNGVETCSAQFVCQSGVPTCLPPDVCDEAADVCIVCTVDCDDENFCNGSESCLGDACLPGDDPCPGQVCNETFDVCGVCADAGDCDDGVFCNGAELCGSTATCAPGTPACPPPDACDEAADACVVCTADCDDGNFCNGVESCFGSTCAYAPPPCPGQPCDEALDECVALPPTPRAGDPVANLSAAERAAFDAGRLAFARAHAGVDGLGPAYNATSCASCHAAGAGGVGDAEITLFGRDDGGGGFDPLAAAGGPLLQAFAVSSECAETLPPAADVVVPRLVTTHLGAGLVEAIADDTLLLREMSPSGGVSGRSVAVEPLEAPGTSRIGRFGAKSDHATLPSIVAVELRDHVGLTSTLAPQDAAPGGDAGVLASCDGVPDPEDAQDGVDDASALVDYVRFLAPPAQTPPTGMNGETLFSLVGCGNCHLGALVTSADPGVPTALRDRTVRPYSDFLVHDMGDAGDGVSTATVGRQEMRTPPLWGARHRPRFWHDGRIAGGSFADRVRAAVEWHDRPGSEAAPAAQSLLALPQASFDRVVEFIGSLGRGWFDGDGDGDVDEADLASFAACYGATSVTASQSCAVHDQDRDGDVDDRDYLVLAFVADVTIGGSVPDGATRPGTPLTVEPAAGGAVTLRWGPSCGVESDFEVYEGPLGEFDAWRQVTCSTGGAGDATFVPQPGDRFFLVAPTDGIGGGSLGLGADGRERSATPFLCRPQATGVCAD